MSGVAVQTECPDRTPKLGSCRCKPKCVICGFGPHMGAHMGTQGNPTLAYDHEYTPPKQPHGETP